MDRQDGSMGFKKETKRPAGARCRLLALVLAGIFALLAFLPISASTPTASAHALPTRSDPQANAILQAPPSQVRMWFSEDVNPFSSKLVVVDPTNREVDQKDSHINASDSREMDLSLPLLPAGTYVVAWRTQSAEDGHIAAGSFLFRIARPDGSVPPLPSKLPTGSVVGGGGVGTTGSSDLNGPTTLQGLATWFALLALAFWVGGVLWETWVLTPSTTREGSLRVAALAASKRFQRLGRYALGVLLVANIGVVVAQTVELAGTWSGVFSPPLLRAVLFGSRFGTFWWLRELATLAALLLAIFAARRGWLGWEALRQGDEERTMPLNAPEVPRWGRAVVETLRSVPLLPARLAGGWSGRSLLGRVQLLLGLLLLVAFALSGHAAAVPPSELAYALGVDLLHLLCTALWLGGLFYIGLAFLPALRGIDSDQRVRVLALGLPEFGTVAIVSAAILALTGSLSTTIHLTSIQQFITTSYGRALFVKIELFLVMVAISAYHAFVLRPRLAYVLSERSKLEQAHPRAALATAEARGARGGPATPRAPFAANYAAEAAGDREDAAGTLERASNRLAARLEDWLRREALVGTGVLLCVALLGVFAGSLATPLTGAASSSTSTGAFVQTQQAGDYTVTLKVVPATFGTNTFTVTVKDKQG
ncbi:MAG TPA: copper resistance protein CopC, partial [Ktedonobacterales bacterium]|nr:copper resistance protein CopC [Ktedonobacterales bacterium]